MIIDDVVLQNSEKISFKLRELYSSYGFKPYRMSKFEEYDLYAKNKDFLVSDNVITFNDPNGKLMALKPDVTLSIIKNNKDIPNLTQKIYYNENVYRVSNSTNSYREIPQTGVECFGYVDESTIFETLKLAIDSLKLLSSNIVLTVSDLDIVENLVNALNLPADKETALYKAINERNFHEIDAICVSSSDELDAIKSLLSINGPINDSLPQLKAFIAKMKNADNYQMLINLLDKLIGGDNANIIYIDFSVTGDINYYNGIIFKGFINGIPDPVVSGGQYDKLMRKLYRKSNAIGFAVYADLIDQYDIENNAALAASDEYINVALPKGRLGEDVYNIFAKSGYDCPSILEQNRKLIFENTEKRIRFFWVKPSDVAIYVKRGVADIGVAGKDILLEYEPDVYELVDLKEGICKMMVAAPKGYVDYPSRPLRVATKFPNIAYKFYQAQGRDIDIVKLNGSIEIAPLLGLTDVIVDIVQTGTTLRENNLEIVDTITPISARLISNKASYKFKNKLISQLVKAIENCVEEK